MTKRLLITFALIALFRIVAVLSVPGLKGSHMEIFSGREAYISVMHLGLQPFAVAFTIVELWSFAFGKGVQLRRSGTIGRRKLTRSAIGVGIVLAIVQADGLAMAFQRNTVLNIAGVERNPGLPFILVTTMTLTAGTALAFLLAQAISRWGIGNGFCLLVVLSAAWSAAVTIGQMLVSSEQIPFSGMEPLVWIGAVGLLARMFWRRPQVMLNGDLPKGLGMTLPAFPQGLAPVVWTYSVFGFLSTFSLIFSQNSTTPVERFHSPIAVPGMAVMMTVFSLGAFHLFSSRERLRGNLPAGALPEGSEVPAGGWVLPTTALLVVFGIVFQTGSSLLGLRFTDILAFPALVVLVAAAFDLVAETRFRARYGEVASIIEMDNVHGASYFSALLARQGIDSVTRAFHYRSLFFFLGPIVKMEVLVPAAEEIRAQKIIRTAGLAIV